MQNNNNVNKVFTRLKSLTNRSQVRAMNRAAKSAFTAASKFIREKYPIKKKDLEEYATLSKATLNNPRVKLIIRHKGISLYKFKGAKGKLGAKATEQRGKRRTYKGTFIATMKSGHTGIMKRTTDKRFPLKELYGPSAMQLFGSEETYKVMMDQFEEQYEKEFMNNMKYYASK